MIKKYAVKIRGVQDPVILASDKGDALIKAWYKYKQAKQSERNGLNIPVKLQGFIGTVGDIYNFTEIIETRAEQGDKNTPNHEVIFDETLKQIRKLDLETRAKQLGAYKTAFLAVVGREPTDEECLEVARRQYVFFKENPKRTIANQDVWQIPKPVKDKTISQIIMLGRASLLNIVNECIRSDIYKAKS